MSTTLNMHHIKSMSAGSASASTNWLKITDRDGNEVTLFVEAHEADALADAWADSQVEPEPITAEDVYSGDTYREAMIEAGCGHLLGDAQ